MNKQEIIQQIELGLSTWKLAEHFNTTQTNMRYWLKKFDLKTNRKSDTLNNHKVCPSCKETKPKSEFYKYKKTSSFCKKCISENNIKKKNKSKQQAVDYKGGKCSKCGYNKCLAALEFHHLDPKTKDKNWNSFRFKFSDKMKTELDKCVLLCSNCHREEHNLS